MQDVFFLISTLNRRYVFILIVSFFYLLLYILYIFLLLIIKITVFALLFIILNRNIRVIKYVLKYKSAFDCNFQ